MSLLRNVLKKNTARSDSAPVAGLSGASKESLLSLKTVKTTMGIGDVDARSVKSSGGVTVHSVRSIAESVTSFASAMLGGKRVPKRRRPDISRLGTPRWYNKNPPPPQETPGTERTDVANKCYTTAHAYSRRKNGAEEADQPYMSVVLFNYAPKCAKVARYYDDTKILGELRVRFEQPDSIEAIDVWCLAKAESSLAVLEVPHVQYHVKLYERRSMANGAGIGPLSSGQTVVFPFEFESFPKDVKVSHPEFTTLCRVPLPPSYASGVVGGFSGQVRYYIGVNIKRSGRMSIDEQWDIPFQYYPLRRPTVRERTMFPFIPDREDWPYTREEIGGWTVTPFGGRGRFRGEMVEIEGLLGVQTPEVYAAGQTLHYGLLLWSKSIPALEALTNTVESDIKVVFASSDVFGTDVLHPRNAARKNRTLKSLVQGRIWRTDDGPPVTEKMPALTEGPNAGKGSGVITKNPALPPKQASPARRSRMEEVFSAWDQENTENEDDPFQGPRPPSPQSDEDTSLGMEEQLERTVRMDGDLRIPSGLLPSFRYKWMGREYVLHITFTHPEYSHISPSGASIYAETPIWIVLGKPIEPGSEEEPTKLKGQNGDSFAALPVIGDVIATPEGAIRARTSRGGPTTKARPVREGPRYGL